MTPLVQVLPQQRDRYTRLRAIEWWQQDRLQRARILVAGAGALGNEVLKNLALVGVGYIEVVDFDTIDVTNLSRSVLFRPTDEQQPKAFIAAKRLSELNPEIRVEGFVGDAVWDVGLGRLRRFDAVLGCVDNREARLGINRNCWKVSVPWIDGALGTLSGQVRVYVPPDSACYECGFTASDYQELNLRYSCQLLAAEGALAGEVPTTPGSASIIAALQVQELLKLLHGQEPLAGHEIEYNGQVHLYRTTRLRRRQECLSHVTIEPDQMRALPQARARTMTDRELLQQVQADLGENAYIQLEGDIINKLVCPRCHHQDQQVRPRHRTGANELTCPVCGRERIAYYVSRIAQGTVTDEPLFKLGIPCGHLVRCGWGHHWLYYELTGDL